MDAAVAASYACCCSIYAFALSFDPCWCQPFFAASSKGATGAFTAIKVQLQFHLALLRQAHRAKPSNSGWESVELAPWASSLHHCLSFADTPQCSSWLTPCPPFEWLDLISVYIRLSSFRCSHYYANQSPAGTKIIIAEPAWLNWNSSDSLVAGLLFSIAAT